MSLVKYQLPRRSHMQDDLPKTVTKLTMQFKTPEESSTFGDYLNANAREMTEMFNARWKAGEGTRGAYLSAIKFIADKVGIGMPTVTFHDKEPNVTE